MSSKSRMNGQYVVGAVLTFCVVAVLSLDATMQFVGPPELIEAMKHTGFQPDVAPRLAIVMLICAVTLALPKTSMLGAILTTAFLGGAIAVHVRIGEITAPPQFFCVLLGVAVWGGQYLRNDRLREILLPYKRTPASADN